MQSENDNTVVPLLGKTLGNFRIIEPIGSGGMATVFKAYEPMLDRYVAIKVLPVYLARDPIFVKRFVQEARSIAKLQHANIVTIHTFGEDHSILYIAMEHVDGGTVRDRLNRGALAVVETVGFMMQAAEALDYAHSQTIVHRDVKPSNMLLRKNGHLLLSDFGIAKILKNTSDDNNTRVGTAIGTPVYMSPEQATGQSIDGRTDIYSLGIAMFHCLTGRLPFTGDSPLTITVKHLNEPLPIEIMRAAGVPPAIEKVVVKMTAKYPAERYQTGHELVEALSEAIVASNIALSRRGSSALLPSQTSAPTIMPPDQGTSLAERSPEFRAQQELADQPTRIANAPQFPNITPVPSTMLFSDALLTRVDLKDFFIIYNRADRSWAKWVVWELEKAGYSAILPPWSFRLDSDFEKEIQKGTAKARHVIVILSPDFFKVLKAQSATLATFQEMVNSRNELLLIYARECEQEFNKQLESINYIDLAGEDELNARSVLFSSIRDEGIKLVMPPSFPGSAFRPSLGTVPDFPNRPVTTQEQVIEAEKSTDVSLSGSSKSSPSYPSQGLSVFFSYSHKDKKLRSELEKYLNHLKRQQLIVGWHDGEIEAGKEWAEEINKHLSEAQIILLLISQDFMASDYCYDIEVQKALVRHKAGEAQVIPIILRPAIWEDTPIGKLQALPAGAKPIIMWSNKELAFLDIAKGIQKAIDKLMNK